MPHNTNRVAARLECFDNGENRVWRDECMGGILNRLIAETEAEGQEHKIADERYVREQRSLAEQVPAVWKSFRAELKSQSEKHPKYFKFSVVPDTEAVIRGTNGRVLEVKFLPDSNVFAFTCNGGEGYCTFRLNRQNVAVICDQDGVQFASLSDAAEELLGLIIKKTG